MKKIFTKALKREMPVLLPAFLFCFFLFACKQSGHQSLNPELEKFIQSPVLLRYEDSAVTHLLIENINRYLHANKELGSLLAFNKVVADSLPKAFREEAEKEIVGLRNQTAVLDSQHVAIIANTMFDKGDRRNVTVFDDTLINLYEQSLLLHKKFNCLDPYSVVWIYKCLGIQYTIAGDLNLAGINYKNEFELYLDLAGRRSNPDYLAGSKVNLSIALREAGYLDSALSILNNIPLTELSAENQSAVQNEQANLLSKLQKPKKAKGLFQHSLLALMPLKSSSARIFSLKADAITGLAKLYFEEQRFDESLQLLDTAISWSQHGLLPKDRYMAKRMILAGKLLEAKGQTVLAATYFQRALATVTPVDTINEFSLPGTEQIYPENTIMEAMDAKANLFEAQFRQHQDAKFLVAAIECYEKSILVERKLMQYFNYNESKFRMLGESRNRSTQAIELCYQLFQKTQNSIWIEKAFEFAEKNKSFVLLESVKRNLASNRKLLADSLYLKMQSLQLQLAWAERNLATVNSDSARKTIRQQIATLEKELLFAKTALMHESDAFQRVIFSNEPVNINQVVQKLLNGQTGLIEFFCTDSVSWLFVLRKNQQPQLLRFNNELQLKARHFISYFSKPGEIISDPAGYQQSAFALFETLNLAKHSKGCKQLYIIPDGIFNRVPFDALLTRNEPLVNFANAPYFIKQCNTMYGYSASIFLQQIGETNPAHQHTAAFAPVFAQKERKQEPLIHSVAEVQTTDGEKFLENKATRNAFMNQMQVAGILHIASHAYADTTSESECRIEFYDSSLYLPELYSLHTKAELVVLSACETGIGQINKTEGSLSLARGFYVAGAKNIITSYWNVDDKNTADLFSHFYASLRDQASARALCKAKRDYLKAAGGTTASPYYWAGFVHLGLDDQKRQTISWWYWLLLIPAGWLAFKLIKRRNA